MLKLYSGPGLLNRESGKDYDDDNNHCRGRRQS